MQLKKKTLKQLRVINVEIILALVFVAKLAWKLEKIWNSHIDLRP